MQVIEIITEVVRNSVSPIPPIETSGAAARLKSLVWRVS